MCVESKDFETARGLPSTARTTDSGVTCARSRASTRPGRPQTPRSATSRADAGPTTNHASARPTVRSPRCGRCFEDVLEPLQILAVCPPDRARHHRCYDLREPGGVT